MRKKIKAFTLLELLVVLAVLGVFSVIAYPNISSWITDREVKKEVYETVAFIKERNINQVTGVEPDVHGSGFIEGQTRFYLNGLDELDTSYLELYTGVTIIKTGEQAIVTNFGVNPTGIDLSL